MFRQRLIAAGIVVLALYLVHSGCSSRMDFKTCSSSASCTSRSVSVRPQIRQHCIADGVVVCSTRCTCQARFELQPAAALTSGKSISVSAT